MARKVKYDFNPFDGLDKKPRGEKASRIKDRVAEFVETQVVEKARSGVSPVSGHGRYKKLNKKYAQQQKGGNRTADLTLTKKMLNSVEVTNPRGNTLRLTVSEEENAKADGHNNFSGASELPNRSFIPNAKKDETLKRDIRAGIKRIVKEEMEE